MVEAVPRKVETSNESPYRTIVLIEVVVFGGQNCFPQPYWNIVDLDRRAPLFPKLANQGTVVRIDPKGQMRVVVDERFQGGQAAVFQQPDVDGQKNRNDSGGNSNAHYAPKQF